MVVSNCRIKYCAREEGGVWFWRVTGDCLTPSVQRSLRKVACKLTFSITEATQRRALR